MNHNECLFLSVIVPVYNVHDYLLQTLDSVSVAASKLPKECGVELICVDDGSTDGSGELLDDYSRREFDNLRCVVIHQPNGGVSVARNVGLDRANGEWIGFVDGDDLVDDGLFFWLYHVTQEHPLLDISCFGAVQVNEKLSRIRLMIGEFPDMKYSSGDALLLDRRTGGWTSGIWDKFYRRSFLDKAQLRFEETMKYDEDTLFAKLCLAQCGEVFASARTSGYLYRMRATSAIHQKAEHMPKDPILQVKRLIELWNRNSTASLKKMICGQTRGLLALCKEDWYAESARKEAIQYLFTTREIRQYVYPFVMKHDMFRTKMILSVFLFSPIWVKRIILWRLCRDHI